jgi:hypothetical protein
VLKKLSLQHRAELRTRGPALLAALRRVLHTRKSARRIPTREASRSRRKT